MEREKGKKRVEAAETQRKLALAPVSGVAGPWVSWAILKEGRRRSAAPPVHKPLCRIPHFVPTRGTVGECVTKVSRRKRLSLPLLGFNWTARIKASKPDKRWKWLENLVSLISIRIQKERQCIIAAKQQNYTKPSPKRVIFMIIVQSAETKVLLT